jgi:hypothetical protein
MFFSKLKLAVLSLMFVFSFAGAAAAQQTKNADGTPSQRLEVLSQKLTSLRRSVSGAVSAFKDDSDKKSKKDEKNSLETPVSRLKSLEKNLRVCNRKWRVCAGKSTARKNTKSAKSTSLKRPSPICSRASIKL